MSKSLCHWYSESRLLFYSGLEAMPYIVVEKLANRKLHDLHNDYNQNCIRIDLTVIGSNTVLDFRVKNVAMLYGVDLGLDYRNGS